MGSHSSRSSTGTSLSIWRKSKRTRAAWWSFVTRCEDIAASHRTPPNNSMQRTALRAAADAERWTATRVSYLHSRRLDKYGSYVRNKPDTPNESLHYKGS